MQVGTSLAPNALMWWLVIHMYSCCFCFSIQHYRDVKSHAALIRTQAAVQLLDRRGCEAAKEASVGV